MTGRRSVSLRLEKTKIKPALQRADLCDQHDELFAASDHPMFSAGDLPAVQEANPCEQCRSRGLGWRFCLNPRTVVPSRVFLPVKRVRITSLFDSLPFRKLN